MFSSPLRSFIPLVCQVRTTYGMSRIGDRDVVGHGTNGNQVYKDDAQHPFPAIRFAENSPNIRALRIKEKGDWKMLCCEDKKALYRASFCQTFAEFQAFTGSWKFITGWGFFLMSFGFWATIFFHFYVQEPLPDSCSYASQQAQLQRMFDIRANPIDGISSLWNYDENNWLYLVPGIIRGQEKMAINDEAMMSEF